VSLSLHNSLLAYRLKISVAKNNSIALPGWVTALDFSLLNSAVFDPPLFSGSIWKGWEVTGETVHGS
jgi:hypothetical protein